MLGEIYLFAFADTRLALYQITQIKIAKNKIRVCAQCMRQLIVNRQFPKAALNLNFNENRMSSGVVIRRSVTP